MKISLSTQRLVLKPVNSTDLVEIHALHSLPETDEFNTLGVPQNVEETRQILQEWINASEREQNPEYTFALRDKTNAFIGLIALKCGNPKFRNGEVWYKLHVKHWGRGYATEALKRVLEFGFSELKLHRIEAGCAIENQGSVRVLEKAGMLREGRKRKVLPLKSGWSDNYIFAIIDEDVVG